MKCSKCSGRRIITTTDQVSFYRTWITSDAAGGLLDIEDGKRLDDGDWWIDTDAPCSCETCDHEGVATDFAEDQDKPLVAEALDRFLYLELQSATKRCDSATAGQVKVLLTLRGRADLTETAG